MAITSVEFNPASANQEQEFICLTNPASGCAGYFRLETGGSGRFYVCSRARSFRRTAYLLCFAGCAGVSRAHGLRARAGARGILWLVPIRGSFRRVARAVAGPQHCQQYCEHRSATWVRRRPALRFLRITEIMYHPGCFRGRRRPLPKSTSLSNCEIFRRTQP